MHAAAILRALEQMQAESHSNPTPRPIGARPHPHHPPSPPNHAPTLARHAEGVVHRDIKPSHVLLNEQQEGRLGDFGLAVRLPDDGKGLRTRTHTTARSRSRT